MAKEKPKSLYALAGVDFEAEDRVVDVLKKGFHATKKNVADVTKRLGMTLPEDIGSFSDGISWALDEAVKNGVTRVELAACVDGSGSEPVVHQLYDGDDPEKKAATGIDSVAMVVNDEICKGARPILLLDYVACHTPNIEIAKDLQAGLVIGANQSGSVLMGGETASLSAMITGPVPPKAYDICAFTVGFVMEPHLIERPLDGSRIQPGDVAIGVASSGVHCNGLTLLWKTAIGFKEHGYANAHLLNEHDEDLGETPAEAILTPTIIYKGPVLDNVLANPDFDVKAVVNVTGGGVKNDLRPLGATGNSVHLDFKGVPKLPVFDYVQKRAGVPAREMLEDYNNSVGMRLYAAPESVDGIVNAINASSVGGRKMHAFVMGEVRGPSTPKVVASFQGTEYTFE